jgi:hypothetical protein
MHSSREGKRARFSQVVCTENLNPDVMVVEAAEWRI